MAFTYVFDPVDRVVRATADGIIRLDDIAAYLQALVDAGLIGMPQLIDTRTARHELTTADTHRLVALVKTVKAPVERTVRTALVVTAPADYGMARMYGSLAEEADPGFAVFRDLAEAEAWVRAGPDAPPTSGPGR